MLSAFYTATTVLFLFLPSRMIVRKARHWRRKTYASKMGIRIQRAQLDTNQSASSNRWSNSTCHTSSPIPRCYATSPGAIPLTVACFKQSQTAALLYVIHTRWGGSYSMYTNNLLFTVKRTVRQNQSAETNKIKTTITAMMTQRSKSWMDACNPADCIAC